MCAMGQITPPQAQDASFHAEFPHGLHEFRTCVGAHPASGNLAVPLEPAHLERDARRCLRASVSHRASARAKSLTPSEPRALLTLWRFPPCSSILRLSEPASCGCMAQQTLIDGQE